MSKSPRVLQELMTAVDAGHAVDVANLDSASSDSRRLLGSGRRSTYYAASRGAAGRAPPPRPVAVVEASSASSEASFEFSAVVSYSSASPASMVFSEGQLRAHQFPAVRSSSSASAVTTSQATSPVRGRSSVGNSYSTHKPHAQQAAAGVMPMMGSSKKRVSFATDGGAAAAAKGGGQGKKSGGLLGCMGSACGSSSTDQAVEPVARNANRKVVAAF